MSILLARISLIAAVSSACALVLSWTGKSLIEVHKTAGVLFFTAFCLSGTAIIAGAFAIFHLKEQKVRRIAWCGATVGSIIFVPTSAVAIILLFIFLSGK